MRRWWSLAVLFLASFASLPAWACAVCGAGQNDESAAAFFRGTIMLSLVPLGAIGGIIFYLYRKTRGGAEEQSSDPGP
jgi:hypothetical protein